MANALRWLAIGLALSTPQLRSQSINFSARRDVPALSSSVVVVDANGDGIPDIVANDTQSGLYQICVYFGNGDGTFRGGPCSPLSIPKDYLALEIATADFNKDGKPDIALLATELASQKPSALYVVFGNGDGTFGSQTMLAPAASESYLGQLITADLNGDGNADVAIRIAAGVLIVPGNGDGTFAASVQVAVPSMYGNGYALQAGDLDGDGTLDLIAGTGKGVVVLLNKGSWVFQVASFVATGKSPIGAALGDLNGDGNLDLVMDLVASGEVFVALGNGHGTFGKPAGTNAPGAGSLVLVGDINGDGKLDVVTSNGYSTVTVLLGNGNGTLTPDGNYTVGFPAASPVLADLRGKGQLDYVIAGDEGTISVLLNRGNGKFFDGTSYNFGSYLQTAAGDFNGDGKPDLAFLTPSGLQVLFGTGNAKMPFTKGPLTPLSLSQLNGYIVAADFNQDGKLDVALSAGVNGSGAVYALLGNGDGTFGAPIETPITIGLRYPPLEMVASDFNSDGIPDIASMGAPVLIGNGDGTFTEGFVPTYSGNALNNFLAVGDLNNDGNQDLVYAGGLGYYGGLGYAVVAFLGNGDGTFSAAIASQESLVDVELIALGDFNGDGFLDLGFSAISPKSYAGVLIGKGDGTFSSAPNLYTSPSWYDTLAVAAADFNGDGKLDLILGLPNSNTLAVLEGHGDGTLTVLPREFGVNNGPGLMTLGFFHGNPKRPDLAVSNADGTISVLINTSK